MSRGTTTMKMIRSTSTTSTSGVILMSDCSSEPNESRLSCMMSISLGAGALGDQSHTAEAGVLDCDHRVPDLAEVEFGVAPDYPPGLDASGLRAHRSTRGFAEIVGADLSIVDPQPAGLINGD